MAHSNYSLNLIEMEPMEDENCVEEFEEVYRMICPYLGISKTADDATFDLIIMELQDILIDPQFEKTLAGFMKNNWAIFDGPPNKQNESKVFEQFRSQLKNYLQTVSLSIFRKFGRKSGISLGRSFGISSRSGSIWLTSKCWIHCSALKMWNTSKLSSKTSEIRMKRRKCSKS